MHDTTRYPLASLVAERLNGLFDLPQGFPRVEFDWVTEDDFRDRVRLEASAPGTWELGSGIMLTHLALKAEIHKFNPANSSGRLEAELMLSHRSVPVTYHFPGPLRFSASVRDVPLEHLLAVFAAREGLLEWLPAFRLRDAELVFAPQHGSFAIQAGTDEIWTLPIGRDGMALRQITLGFERAGMGEPLQGRLHGTARLGGRDYRVGLEIPGHRILAGLGEVIDVAPVIDSLCDPASLKALAAPFAAQLQPARLNIDLDQKAMAIQGVSPVFGETTVVILRHQGVWGFAADGDLAEGWRLSRLVGFLNPLDGLDMSRATMMVTSFGEAPYLLGRPECEPKYQPRAGYNFHIPMPVEGTAALNYLSHNIGFPTEATLAGTLTQGLGGGRLEMESPLLSFALTPNIDLIEPRLTVIQDPEQAPEVWVTGKTRVTLHGDALNFSGRMRVLSERLELTASLDNAWMEPLATAGIRLDPLRLEIRKDADFKVMQSLTGRARIELEEGAAHLVWGTHAATHEVHLAFDYLPIRTVMGSMLPKAAPSVRPEVVTALAEGFQMVEMILTPNMRRIQGVVRLAGGVGDFMGEFDAEKGLQAIGSLSPLRWFRVAEGGYVVSLLKATPDPLALTPNIYPNHRPGPSLRMHIGPGEEAGIYLGAEMTLFAKYKQTVLATFTRAGLSFPFQYQDPHVSFSLECSVTEGVFRAKGYLGVEMNLEMILLEPKARLCLGSVRMTRAVFEAGMTLTLTTGFEAEMSGAILWQGQRLEVPKFTITSIPSSLHDFEGSIRAALQERAFTVLRPLLATEDAFFAAAAEGWLHTGRDLRLTAADLVNALRNTFTPGAETLTNRLRGLGYPTPDIALALKASARLTPEALVRALHAAGSSGIQIAAALKSAFEAKPESIAQGLRIVGFECGSISQALKMGAHCGPEETTAALKFLGYDLYEIALALRESHQAPALTVFTAFRVTGYKARDTVKALSLAYQTGKEESEELLGKAGFPPRDIRAAMEKVFVEGNGMYGA